MERNQAAARHSWAGQHAWLLLNFFPMPVGQTIYAHCTCIHTTGLFRVRGNFDTPLNSVVDGPILKSFEVGIANTGWFDLVYNNASQVGNYHLKIWHNFWTNFETNEFSEKSEKIWSLQSDSMSTIWPKRGRHSILLVFFSHYKCLKFWYFCYSMKFQWK